METADITGEFLPQQSGTPPMESSNGSQLLPTFLLPAQKSNSTPSAGTANPGQSKPNDCRVQVAVRVRPFIEMELDNYQSSCVKTRATGVTIGSDKEFEFDKVIDQTATQEAVYECCMRGLLTKSFEGYNSTVLAYGQTGSGKTHTMGTSNFNLNDANEMGILPRVIREIFRVRRENEKSIEMVLKISYFEIYNDNIIDLLDSNLTTSASANKKSNTSTTQPAAQITPGIANVIIREEVDGSINLYGITEEKVNSPEEMLAALERGGMCRSTSATLMNQTSSRSHAVFTIFLEQSSIISSADIDDSNNKNSSGNGEVDAIAAAEGCKTSKLHFVDLAGSERLKRTGAVGATMKEGININMGLLSLGNVISALTEPNPNGKKHIPYRDSKLTRILQDSLGGNSNTLMIACISPAESNFEESLNTLKYASRARRIKNKPVVNRDPQSALITSLKQAVQDAIADVATMRVLLEKNGIPVPESISNASASSNTMMDKRQGGNKSGINYLGFDGGNNSKGNKSNNMYGGEDFDEIEGVKELKLNLLRHEKRVKELVAENSSLKSSVFQSEILNLTMQKDRDDCRIRLENLVSVLKSNGLMDTVLCKLQSSGRSSSPSSLCQENNNKYNIIQQDLENDVVHIEVEIKNDAIVVVESNFDSINHKCSNGQEETDAGLWRILLQMNDPTKNMTLVEEYREEIERMKKDLHNKNCAYKELQGEFEDGLKASLRDEQMLIDREKKITALTRQLKEKMIELQKSNNFTASTASTNVSRQSISQQSYQKSMIMMMMMKKPTKSLSRKSLKQNILFDEAKDNVISIESKRKNQRDLTKDKKGDEEVGIVNSDSGEDDQEIDGNSSGSSNSCNSSSDEDEDELDEEDIEIIKNDPEFMKKQSECEYEENQKKQNLSKVDGTINASNARMREMSSEQLILQQKLLKQMKEQYHSKIALLEMDMRRAKQQRDDALNKLSGTNTNSNAGAAAAAAAEKQRVIESFKSKVQEMSNTLNLYKQKAREQEQLQRTVSTQEKQISQLGSEIAKFKQVKANLFKEMKKNTEEFEKFKQKKCRDIMLEKRKGIQKERTIFKLQNQTKKQERLLMKKAEDIKSLIRSQELIKKIIGSSNSSASSSLKKAHAFKKSKKKNNGQQQQNQKSEGITPVVPTQLVRSTEGQQQNDTNPNQINTNLISNNDDSVIINNNTINNLQQPQNNQPMNVSITNAVPDIVTTVEIDETQDLEVGCESLISKCLSKLIESIEIQMNITKIEAEMTAIALEIEDVQNQSIKLKLTLEKSEKMSQSLDENYSALAVAGTVAATTSSLTTTDLFSELALDPEIFEAKRELEELQSRLENLEDKYEYKSQRIAALYSDESARSFARYSEQLMTGQKFNSLIAQKLIVKLLLDRFGVTSAEILSTNEKIEALKHEIVGATQQISLVENQKEIITMQLQSQISDLQTKLKIVQNGYSIYSQSAAAALTSQIDFLGEPESMANINMDDLDLSLNTDKVHSQMLSSSLIFQTNTEKRANKNKGSPTLKGEMYNKYRQIRYAHQLESSPLKHQPSQLYPSSQTQLHSQQQQQQQLNLNLISMQSTQLTPQTQQLQQQPLTSSQLYAQQSQVSSTITACERLKYKEQIKLLVKQTHELIMQVNSYEIKLKKLQSRNETLNQKYDDLQKANRKDPFIGINKGGAIGMQSSNGMIMNSSSLGQTQQNENLNEPEENPYGMAIPQTQLSNSGNMQNYFSNSSTSSIQGNPSIISGQQLSNSLILGSSNPTNAQATTIPTINSAAATTTTSKPVRKDSSTLTSLRDRRQQIKHRNEDHPASPALVSQDATNNKEEKCIFSTSTVIDRVSNLDLNSATAVATKSKLNNANQLNQKRSLYNEARQTLRKQAQQNPAQQHLGIGQSLGGIQLSFANPQLNEQMNNNGVSNNSNQKQNFAGRYSVGANIKRNPSNNNGIGNSRSIQMLVDDLSSAGNLNSQRSLLTQNLERATVAITEAEVQTPSASFGIVIDTDRSGFSASAESPLRFSPDNHFAAFANTHPFSPAGSDDLSAYATNEQHMNSNNQNQHILSQFYGAASSIGSTEVLSAADPTGTSVNNNNNNNTGGIQIMSYRNSHESDDQVQLPNLSQIILGQPSTQQQQQTNVLQMQQQQQLLQQQYLHQNTQVSSSTHNVNPNQSLGSSWHGVPLNTNASCKYECVGKISDAHSGQIFSVENHENLLFSTSSKSMKIWDIETLKCISDLQVHNGFVRGLAVLHSEKWIATSCDKFISLWDIVSLKKICSLKSHNTDIKQLRFDDDIGMILYSAGKGASNAGALVTWDVRKQAILEEREKNQDIFAVLPQNNVIYYASRDHSVRRIPMESNTPPMEPFTPPHLDGVTSLAMLNGSLVSGSKDKKLKLWHINNYNHNSSVNGGSTQNIIVNEKDQTLALNEQILCLESNSSRNLLYAGQRDGKVKIITTTPSNTTTVGANWKFKEIAEVNNRSEAVNCISKISPHATPAGIENVFACGTADRIIKIWKPTNDSQQYLANTLPLNQSNYTTNPDFHHQSTTSIAEFIDQD